MSNSKVQNYLDETVCYQEENSCCDFEAGADVRRDQNKNKKYQQKQDDENNKDVAVTLVTSGRRQCHQEQQTFAEIDDQHHNKIFAPENENLASVNDESTLWRKIIDLYRQKKHDHDDDLDEKMARYLAEKLEDHNNNKNNSFLFDKIPSPVTTTLNDEPTRELIREKTMFGKILSNSKNPIHHCHFVKFLTQQEQDEFFNKTCRKDLIRLYSKELQFDCSTTATTTNASYEELLAHLKTRLEKENRLVTLMVGQGNEKMTNRQFSYMVFQSCRDYACLDSSHASPHVFSMSACSAGAHNDAKFITVDIKHVSVFLFFFNKRVLVDECGFWVARTEQSTRMLQVIDSIGRRAELGEFKVKLSNHVNKLHKNHQAHKFLIGTFGDKAFTDEILTLFNRCVFWKRSRRPVTVELLWSTREKGVKPSHSQVGHPLLDLDNAPGHLIPAAVSLFKCLKLELYSQYCKNINNNNSNHTNHQDATPPPFPIRNETDLQVWCQAPNHANTTRMKSGALEKTVHSEQVYLEYTCTKEGKSIIEQVSESYHSIICNETVGRIVYNFVETGENNTTMLRVPRDWLNPVFFSPRTNNKHRTKINQEEQQQHEKQTAEKNQALEKMVNEICDANYLQRCIENVNEHFESFVGIPFIDGYCTEPHLPRFKNVGLLVCPPDHVMVKKNHHDIIANNDNRRQRQGDDTDSAHIPHHHHNHHRCRHHYHQYQQGYYENSNNGMNCYYYDNNGYNNNYFYNNDQQYHQQQQQMMMMRNIHQCCWCGQQQGCNCYNDNNNNGNFGGFNNNNTGGYDHFNGSFSNDQQQGQQFTSEANWDDCVNDVRQHTSMKVCLLGDRHRAAAAARRHDKTKDNSNSNYNNNNNNNGAPQH